MIFPPFVQSEADELRTLFPVQGSTMSKLRRMTPKEIELHEASTRALYTPTPTPPPTVTKRGNRAKADMAVPSDRDALRWLHRATATMLEGAGGEAAVAEVRAALHGATIALLLGDGNE